MNANSTKLLDRRWRLAAVLGLVAMMLSWLTAKVLPAYLTFSFTFLLLGIVPSIVGWTLLRLSPRMLGLGMGDTKTGLRLVALGVPLAGLAGYVGSRSPALAAFYPMAEGVTREFSSFGPHVLWYGLYYVGYEFFFRGYLLLGFESKVGAGRSNLTQAILTVLIHVGRPVSEMAAAFPGSLVFGWLTLKTRSVWYAILIHWLVGITLDWIVIQ